MRMMMMNVDTNNDDMGDDVFMTGTASSIVASKEVLTQDEVGPSTTKTSTSTTNYHHETTTTTTTTPTTTKFTEAVPLSLSSMAHLNVPFTDGVIDGIIQVIHHTLIQCVNYITPRISGTSNNNNNNNPSSYWNDITTTPYAWIPIKDENPLNIKNLPHILQKMNFIHLYSRNAFIYYKPKLPNLQTYTQEKEMELWQQMNYNNHNNNNSGGSGSNNNNDEWYSPPTAQQDSTSTTTSSSGIVGRIRLFYGSPEPLTPDELNGTSMDDDDDDDDDNDIPPCILYQMKVEYCCIAPTCTTTVAMKNNTIQQYAIHAEEISMLSFGSNMYDDDIKYGALASLHDTLAKYVLEIYSVRGKKYKFDLMDTTLSDGTIPHIPPAILRNNSITNTKDLFLKNLCVTVTDHNNHLPSLSSSIKEEEEHDDDDDDDDGGGGAHTTQQSEMRDVMSDDKNTSNDNMNNNNSTISTTTTATKQRGTAITHIYLTLEGKLRTNGNSRSSEGGPNYFSMKGNDSIATSSTATTTATTTTDMIGSLQQLQDVPAFDYLKNVISYAFLRLNPNPSDMVSAHPSGHTLLLDPDMAGHIYINGRYAMTWGDDNGISASHGTALFGIDLHSIPFWNGRIVDYELVKETYAQLWYEILIDAKLQHLNIASKLLQRLMKGVDPVSTTILEEDTDLYDDIDDDDDENATNSPDIHQDCLESIILAAPNYDRVGIAAKALATRFAIEFGKMSFPCLAHETEWVKRTLPNRNPIVVPQRLINILRRGGYFDVQKTVDLLWFTESRPIRDEYEIEIVNIAVQYLEVAGCIDVDSENIVLISSPVADNVIAKDDVCRWDPTSEQFYVHEDFFKLPINDLVGNGVEEASDTTPQQIKGYLLGMYIAKAHPVGYGKILARYLVRNKL